MITVRAFAEYHRFVTATAITTVRIAVKIMIQASMATSTPR